MQFDKEVTIIFSEEEIIQLYTMLCALPKLPPTYWRLREKIEQHVYKKCSITDVANIQENIAKFFTHSKRED